MNRLISKAESLIRKIKWTSRNNVEMTSIANELQQSVNELFQRNDDLREKNKALDAAKNKAIDDLLTIRHVVEAHANSLGWCSCSSGTALSFIIRSQS